jgi:hypothetical protein
LDTNDCGYAHPCVSLLEEGTGLLGRDLDHVEQIVVGERILRSMVVWQYVDFFIILVNMD